MMTSEHPHNPGGLPKGPDWSKLTLDETWPDRLDFSRWSGWRELFRAFTTRRRQRVQVPGSLLGRDIIPKYVLQEFHNLPNGNYSRRFSRGYITGFDVMMMGRMDRARQWIATRLQNARAVADVGTAGGRTAAAIKKAGVPYVCGVDPCPYLLQHAAADNPGVEFVQGVAEQLPFSNGQLDGLSLCFVLHEMPPLYIERALKEFFRVLQPGGRVVLVEPSAAQMQMPPLKKLTGKQGWLHLYFAALARMVHEPFIPAWHKLDKRALFTGAGFIVLEEYKAMPFHCWVAQKPAK